MLIYKAYSKRIGDKNKPDPNEEQKQEKKIDSDENQKEVGNQAAANFKSKGKVTTYYVLARITLNSIYSFFLCRRHNQKLEEGAQKLLRCRLGS